VEGDVDPAAEPQALRDTAAVLCAPGLNPHAMLLAVKVAAILAQPFVLAVTMACLATRRLVAEPLALPMPAVRPKPLPTVLASPFLNPSHAAPPFSEVEGNRLGNGARTVVKTNAPVGESAGCGRGKLWKGRTFLCGDGRNMRSARLYPGRIGVGCKLVRRVCSIACFQASWLPSAVRKTPPHAVGTPPPQDNPPATRRPLPLQGHAEVHPAQLVHQHSARERAHARPKAWHILRPICGLLPGRQEQVHHIFQTGLCLPVFRKTSCKAVVRPRAKVEGRHQRLHRPAPLNVVRCPDLGLRGLRPLLPLARSLGISLDLPDPPRLNVVVRRDLAGLAPLGQELQNLGLTWIDIVHAFSPEGHSTVSAGRGFFGVEGQNAGCVFGMSRRLAGRSPSAIVRQRVESMGRGSLPISRFPAPCAFC
jgi:hypothetical protein